MALLIRECYVLDPCCGTGAPFVEVVRRIHETITEAAGTPSWATT